MKLKTDFCKKFLNETFFSGSIFFVFLLFLVFIIFIFFLRFCFLLRPIFMDATFACLKKFFVSFYFYIFFVPFFVFFVFLMLFNCAQRHLSFKFFIKNNTCFRLYTIKIVSLLFLKTKACSNKKQTFFILEKF